MVLLIEEIASIKGYKELTVYLAVNIADRYLAQLARTTQPVPSIVILGITCLLLAVKMNEPICPHFGNMVLLINSQNKEQISIKDLTTLERHILVVLDFDLQSETSLNFVERFC